MKKIVIGIVVGIALTVTLMLVAVPKMMLVETPSPYGFAETVKRIETNVEKGGWTISHTFDIQKSLKKHGKESNPVTVIKICHPEHAAAVLNDDKAAFASVLMPCSISVYEKSDGKTYVSTMNAGLMGRMFGGTISKVMAGAVAKETAEFTAFLNNQE